MKFSFSIIIALGTFIMGCSYPDKKDFNEKKNKTISVKESDACYAFIHNKDSVLLHLEIKNDIVTGDLSYNFFEKDDNAGPLIGELHGDTIFAMYKFRSEGTTSEREVAFLKKGNTYVEGFGEIQDEEGRTVFKNKKLLNFESNLILKEIDCIHKE